MKQVFMVLVVFISGIAIQAQASQVGLGVIEVVRDGGSTDSNPDPLEKSCIELQKQEIVKMTNLDPDVRDRRIAIQLFVEARGGIQKSDRPEIILPLARSPFAIELEDRNDGLAESNLGLELTRMGECIYTMATDLRQALDK